MATTATKKPATSKKPAKTRPAARPAKGSAKAKTVSRTETPGVSITDLARRLNLKPKSLRASIRRMYGGAQVGKGGRYGWKSFNDPQVKEIMARLSGDDKGSRRTTKKSA